MLIKTYCLLEQASCYPDLYVGNDDEDIFTDHRIVGSNALSVVFTLNCLSEILVPR